MENNDKKMLSKHFDGKKKGKKIDPATLKEGGREGRLKALEYNRRMMLENPDQKWRRKQLKDQLEYHKKQENIEKGRVD